MTEIEKHRRLKAGPVYLVHQFEECMIRTEPGTRLRVFVKFKGKEEFESSQSSNIVTEAFMEWVEGNREQYKNY